MLSDEERKAVDKIKTLIQYLNVWKENFTIVPEDVKYLVTILNLIEKQQKEIEELKDMNERQKYRIELVSEDKIEDRKVQIEYNNVFKKGVKSVEDKIKAKIEELEKEQEQEKDIFNHMMTVDNRYNIKYQVLKELLEKE